MLYYMGGLDRREQLQVAGRWLREQREKRGFPKLGSFARAVGVDPSQISNYERGVNAVTDERAEQIAAALGMSVMEVRRNLGLWVPEVDDDETAIATRLVDMPEADVAEFLAGLPDDKGDRILAEYHAIKARRNSPRVSNS